MLAVGDRVTVLFSECKGFGAEKVGQCGTVTHVEALRELVGMYRVEFPDGAWHYLDREVERAARAAALVMFEATGPAASVVSPRREL